MAWGGRRLLFRLALISILPGLLCGLVLSSLTSDQLLGAEAHRIVRAIPSLAFHNIGEEQIFQSVATQFCDSSFSSGYPQVTVIRADRSVFCDSRHRPSTSRVPLYEREITSSLSGELGFSLRTQGENQPELFYVSLPITQGGDAGKAPVVIGALRISEAGSDLRQSINANVLRTLLATMAAAILAGTLATLFLSTPLRDLKTLTIAARHYAKGNLSERFRAPVNSEIRELTDAMNEMAAQLDDRIRAVVQEKNEQLALLSSMVEAVLAVDLQHRLMNMNQSAAVLFGIEAHHIGRGVRESLRDYAVQEFVSRALESDDVLEDDIELFGETKQILEARAAPWRDSSGNKIGVVLVFHDVTQLRRLDAVRKDFVANVSHELRTPITSIKGFVETLLEGGLQHAEDGPRFLGIISRHVDRLNAIIEDLLTLSRIENDVDSQSIPLMEADVAPVVSTAVTLCQGKATERRIQLSYSAEGRFPARVNAVLLEQAVANLVENAVKYSETGKKVHVDVRAERNEVVIEVQDQGCGISHEHLSRVFERFYRVDKGRSRVVGGTGLGLSIVKHVALAHKGRVAVESTLGLGSTFSIHLPRS